MTDPTNVLYVVMLNGYPGSPPIQHKIYSEKDRELAFEYARTKADSYISSMSMTVEVWNSGAVKASSVALRRFCY